MKKEIIENLISIADELDIEGYIKTSNKITKIAQNIANNGNDADDIIEKIDKFSESLDAYKGAFYYIKKDLMDLEIEPNDLNTINSLIDTNILSEIMNLQSEIYKIINKYR